MHTRTTARRNVPPGGNKHTLVVRLPEYVVEYLRRQGDARRTSLAAQVVRLVDEAIRSAQG